MAEIFILGAGGWGIAMAVSQAKQGHNVSLWSPFHNEVMQLQQYRCSANLLPNVILPENVKVTENINDGAGADILVIAVPSFAVFDVAEKMIPIADNKYVVILSKGFDETTHERLSVVVSKKLTNSKVVVLSGPSHAEEVAFDTPTLCVTASTNLEYADYIRDILSHETFRLYSTDDVAGVEIGGAVKNVIALAAGIIDGMNYGDNSKAALMTRGIVEMKRLGIKMGGKEHTFYGLAGIGDLIVTCGSTHSRNHEAGFYIGRGMTPEGAVKKVGKTVEGYKAAKIVKELANKYNVELPIVNGIYDILYNNANARDILKGLMTRELIRE